MNEPTQDAFEKRSSRYVVGIDLGTTNCAVAYLDTNRNRPKIELFRIDQWVDFGAREGRELLPSFHYQPTQQEASSLAVGTQSGCVVGVLARDRGLQLPGRQIASAKSWLCHDAVDRRAAILPWQSDDDVDRLSPVEVSSRYLRHIRQAWDRTHDRDPLAEQDVVLTLPASFDQVARQLTVEAAALAGLPRVILIEEPQAAFYAWLNLHPEDWEQIVASGQTILVCDIGGGTTDFTLIRARQGATEPVRPEMETLHDRNQGRLSLHRVAVGQHLILGGDNLDLALARYSEHKMVGDGRLPPRAWDALRQACRVAKETLLGSEPPESYTMHLPGSGARLVGGGQSVQVTASEIESVVLDGFFPRCRLSDRPAAEQTGFREFGLPFAHDAAITRHLAAFLWDHRWDGRTDQECKTWTDLQAARPDWILFNGGVLESDLIKDRLLSTIADWFAGSESISKTWRPKVLAGDRLDVAVARGAAYFGQVRRGSGVAIEAKLARSYYVVVSLDPMRAVCVVPGAAGPGDRYELVDMPFELAVGVPVQFPIVYSSTRLADRVGVVYDVDEQNFTHLPPIRTVLEIPGRKRQDRLPVVLESELTQIGTMQLWCATTDHRSRWKLEFDVRSTTETDREAQEALAAQGGIVDTATQAIARSAIEECFAELGMLKPTKLMQTLADRLQMNRQSWPPSLLRSMWQDLMDFEPGRRRSAEHEARWLNLVGYMLRPGYGMAADDWRVAQTWRTVYGRLAFATANSRSESLILWRRLAGGFTAGQQLAVYQQVAGPLRSLLDPVKRNKGGGVAIAPNDLAELLRLVGSLELLPKSEKAQLGDWLIALQSNKKWAFASAAIFWAVGRFGSRVPAYAPLNCVLDIQQVESWLDRLMSCNFAEHQSAMHLCLMQCARRVDDRYRDIGDSIRRRVLELFANTSAPDHYRTLVEVGGQLAGEEASQIVGESLPLGLTRLSK